MDNNKPDIVYSNWSGLWDRLDTVPTSELTSLYKQPNIKGQRLIGDIITNVQCSSKMNNEVEFHIIPKTTFDIEKYPLLLNDHLDSTANGNVAKGGLSTNPRF